MDRREKVTGWRELRNEELQNFYTSPNITMVIMVRGAGHLTLMREMRNHTKFYRETLSGRDKSGRPRRRYEDNVKVYIKEVGTGFNSLRIGPIGG